MVKGGKVLLLVAMALSARGRMSDWQYSMEERTVKAPKRRLGGWSGGALGQARRLWKNRLGPTEPHSRHQFVESQKESLGRMQSSSSVYVLLLVQVQCFAASKRRLLSALT